MKHTHYVPALKLWWCSAPSTPSLWCWIPAALPVSSSSTSSTTPGLHPVWFYSCCCFLAWGRARNVHGANVWLRCKWETQQPLSEVPLCPSFPQQRIPHLPSPEEQKMPLAPAVKHRTMCLWQQYNRILFARPQETVGLLTLHQKDKGLFCSFLQPLLTKQNPSVNLL